MKKDENYDGFGMSGYGSNYNPIIINNNNPVITVNVDTDSCQTRTDSRSRTEGIDSSGLQGLLSGIGGLMRIMSSL